MNFEDMNWIDVHVHLDLLQKEKSIRRILEEARQSGIQQVITIGTSPEDLPKVFDLAREFSPSVFCALGVHPHEASFFDSKSEEFLRRHLNSEVVVAVGEIGLDYHYKHSKPEVQRDVFRKQLNLALECHLPIEIHTREAEKDTIEILKETKTLPSGLIHCFTGSEWLADQALSLGLHLSFSGIITFKKSDSLREVVKKTPLECLHIETDAPFLSPVPFRGKTNFPSYMTYTAEKVAEIKQISLEDLSQKTLENSQKLFQKLKPFGIKNEVKTALKK